MEFPIYPYLIAVGYKIVGFHEQIGRVLSYVAALLTLFLFTRLAAYLLPPPGAIAAGVFFALNPIAVRLATTIQPEPFMLLGYVGAMYAFVRWLQENRWRWYWTALVLTSFAILAKAPAAHVGLAFAMLALWRRGPAILKSARLWAFALAAILPPALWYAHAREFWLAYGNSLGVSNHHHFVGLTTFTDPSYIPAIIGIDVHFVWTLAGVLAVALAIAIGPRPSDVGYGLFWYGAVFVYYLVIAGTSAFAWGTYYHIVSVPPVALLVGWTGAVLALRFQDLDSRSRRMAGAVALCATIAFVVANHVVEAAGTAVLIAAAAGGALVTIMPRPSRNRRPLMAKALATGALASLVLVALLSTARITYAERHSTSRSVPEYQTARMFAPLMPPGVLIVSSGGDCISPTESAYEHPWYFYWTDHKGFSPCVQDHTLPEVHALMRRGARYFIVERRALAKRPTFETDMRREFPVVAETPWAILFKLTR